MKNLLIAFAVFITATMASYSLSPIIVVTNHNSGANLNVKVENAIGGAAYSETITGVTPNGSGLLIFIVGKGSTDWTNIPESSVTTAHTVDVYDGTTLIAQYRLDYLIDASARAGLVGGDLVVSGETTFEGDVIVKGNTIFQGMFGLSSGTFEDLTELGNLETNIMIYEGNALNGAQNEISSDDLSEDLLDNSQYYIVNDFNESGSALYFYSSDTDQSYEIYDGEALLLLKAGGRFYVLQHPDSFGLPQN